MSDLLPALFCGVGDVVEIKETIRTILSENEQPTIIEKSARYEAASVVGWGWNLKLISGRGPEWLRIINSDMAKYVVLVRRGGAL